MNRSFELGVVVLSVAFVAPVLAGCADDETTGMPKYPEAIGYDVPAEPPANGGLAADPSSAPPAPPPPPPAPADGLASAATGEDGQPGDVAIGADDSQYADTDPSALTDFHSALDPYGSWVDDPNYGTVWTPSDSVVGDDFQPYVSNGQWTYDDSGDYVWASDYDWGWAPFHYGRWAYLGNRWGWIPGRTYAGAWVSWRYGGGYLGWAPLPPTWYWRGGYAFGLGHVPYAPYSFCGYHDVFGPNVRGRLVAGAQVGTVAARTVPYTPSSPSVGRTPAHPTVGGPSPSMLGLSGREVARTPANNAGIQHAQAFSRPSTAQSLGAHAPAQVASRGTFGARGDSSLAGRAGMSAYGRNAAVATAPRYQGVSPAPYHSPSYSSPSHYGGGTYGSYGGYPGSRSFGTSSYGGARYSSPAYSHVGPAYGGAYGGYRGGTSGRSSGHPSAPSEGGGESAPAVHSSGGFRGGGFHGGGHAGGGGRR